MSDILLLIDESGQLGKLATLLKLDQGTLTTLAVGNRALAEEVAEISASVKWANTEEKPAENYAASVAQAIEELAPKAVVAVATPGSRAAAGMLACAWEAPTISNAISVEVADDVVRAEHMVLENKVIETVEMPAPAIILVDPVSLYADETVKGAPSAIEEIAVQDAGFVELVGVEPAEASALQGAEIVVAVGRGIAGGDAFDKAKSLCETLGAEMGCSRPVAVELGLLPQDRYIGMSGKYVDPKLYIGLGISGYAQHVMGMKNSKAIVVVNSDPKAFFFENADYGIVGDIKEVVPELERAFKAALSA